MKIAAMVLGVAFAGFVVGCSGASEVGSGNAAASRPDRDPPALVGSLIRQCTEIVEEGDEGSARKVELTVGAREINVRFTKPSSQGDKATFDPKYHPTEDVAIVVGADGKKVKMPWFRYFPAGNETHGYDYNQVKIHPFLFDAKHDGSVQDADGNDQPTLKLVLDAGDRSDGMDLTCGKAERVIVD
jgi:hypothetical protein